MKTKQHTGSVASGGELYKCPASSIERVDYHLSVEHNHPAEVGVKTAAKIAVDVKRKAEQNIFRSAGAIVDKVLLKEREVNVPCPQMSKPENLVRAAHCLKEKKRPVDTTDMEFLKNDKHIPEDFMKADIHKRKMVSPFCHHYSDFHLIKSQETVY